MNHSIEVRRARAADLAAAQCWLTEAGLPAADLTAQHMQSFLVGVIEKLPVGMIGLEPLGSVALLRSLVVDESHRSSGVGAQLVAALERIAADQGIMELWLLTIDAERYFARLGYRVRERSEAPDPIRGTAEYASLCPGDAVLMSKP